MEKMSVERPLTFLDVRGRSISDIAVATFRFTLVRDSIDCILSYAACSKHPKCVVDCTAFHTS